MNCKNCEKQLIENDNYCNDCGAKVIDSRLTFRHLISEAKENFFSIDSNKPIRTFADLFSRPEDVIGGYINGVRKKYINAFGYFTIAITLTSLFYFIALRMFPESISSSFDFFQTAPEQQAMNKDIQDATFEYQSLLYFTLIPVFALITYILFIVKRKYNYIEHLIISLYGYSQASIIAIILYFLTVWYTPIFKYVMLITILLQMVYFGYMLKRVFALTLGQIMLKTLLFIPLGLFFYIMISIVLVMALVSFGIMELKDFIPQKETQEAVSYIASSIINWTS